MTYYEELGVRQDAPLEDIRQAYKLLARLLHPDNQVEPALQPIAQRQMQRLVEVVAVLSDPGKRSQYDEMLAMRNNRLPAQCRRQAISASVPPRWRESNNRAAELALRHWFWILNGLFVVTFGTWAFVQGNPGAADHSRVQSGGWQGTSMAHQSSQKKSSQRTNQPQRQRTSVIVNSSPALAAEGIPITELPPLTPPKPLLFPPATETIPPTLLTFPELPAESAKPQDMAPLPKVSSFAGRWLYSPQPGDVSERGMYSAVYVELLLAEHAGELMGDYRARYNVPDRAVSPEVTFTIRGEAGSATSGKVSWRSDDNAKGQAEMTLRAPDVLNINWWTTEFGRHATLGSGTAALIRLQVP